MLGLAGSAVDSSGAQLGMDAEEEAWNVAGCIFIRAKIDLPFFVGAQDDDGPGAGMAAAVAAGQALEAKFGDGSGAAGAQADAGADAWAGAGGGIGSIGASSRSISELSDAISFAAGSAALSLRPAQAGVCARRVVVPPPVACSLVG